MHRDQLNAVKAEIEAAKLDIALPVEVALHADLRSDYIKAKGEFANTSKEYNKQIEIICGTIIQKLKKPFAPITELVMDLDVDDAIRHNVLTVNAQIVASNKITEGFSTIKNDALLKLKKHFTAKLYENGNIADKMNSIAICNRLTGKTDRLLTSLQARNVKLEASISDAQRGREVINEYVCNFLGHKELLIDVVKEENVERFKLLRRGRVAKNLSEGEKTSIAFSFFIAKLEEISNPSEAIIYIDDPISSLDSNHIFQVNAVIKNILFYQKLNSDGNLQWYSKYKQIFFSTHNFEFFSLLKELPSNKSSLRVSYYNTKRIDRDKSTIINMPKSILKHSSEYHYLYSVIHKFQESTDKTDIEILLPIPNAVRRFLELYTYTKIPRADLTVDKRADMLFSPVESKRICKVLHYFSHNNNIEGLTKNSDLLSDIENVVNDIIEILKNDSLHHAALLEFV